MTFAERLKKIRKTANLTQQAMADLMLIPRRTIQDWEGEKATPPEYVQHLVLEKLEQLTQT
jgi:DNA-binding transcriptional regulator YiaG